MVAASTILGPHEAPGVGGAHARGRRGTGAAKHPPTNRVTGSGDPLSKSLPDSIAGDSCK